MDIVASILELTGLWLVGNRARVGFACNLVGCWLWVAVAIDREVYGLLIVGVVAGCVNVRNWLRWRSTT